MTGTTTLHRGKRDKSPSQSSGTDNQASGATPAVVASVKSPPAGSGPREGFSFTNLFLCVIALTIVVQLGVIIGQNPYRSSSSSLSSDSMPSIIINTSSGPDESTVVVGTTNGSTGASTTAVHDGLDGIPSSFLSGENVCAGKKPDLPNVECVIAAVENVGPQSGANVTVGYRGEMSVSSTIICLYQRGMLDV